VDLNDGQIESSIIIKLLHGIGVVSVFAVNVKRLFDLEFFPPAFAAFKVNKPARTARIRVDDR
jgi:hypothetical protein